MKKCAFFVSMTIYKKNFALMNKKQIIRLNESDLNRLVKETVKHVLKENNVNVYDTLMDVAEKMWQIKESGLIALTSPNPSSTELELKQCIEKADAYIYKAARLYKSLY